MKFLVLISTLVLINFGKCHELKGTLKQFQFLYQIFTGDFSDIKKKEKLEKAIVKNETSNYYGEFSIIYRCFLIFKTISDYLTYLDTTKCFSHEIYEAERRDKRAKCTRAKGNGTLFLMNSLTDVMTLLAPNKNEPNTGNCIVMLFFAKFCPGCQALIPHYNSLARNFPDVKVAALDALEHQGFNTEFGIIGLPSIILFHNGRIVQKFNISQPATVTNFVNFIMNHTNLKPNSSSVVTTSDDFSPTSPLKVAMQEEKFDIYLWLSWIFIIVCCIYYFTRSRTFRQITEMINRTWRESNEAAMQ
jgi:thiol-disulfide isomerase/thioredoxin